MDRDRERIERNRSALRDARIDVLVCALPMNVLLLSGYWPVVGTSMAVFTASGEVILLVPEDERQLADGGWADEVISFAAGSLHDLQSPIEAVAKPLAGIASKLKIRNATIGFESGPVSEPSSYAAMNLYGAAAEMLIGDAFPAATLAPAGDVMARLRSTLTPGEVERLKTACVIAREAYLCGRNEVREGFRETEAAASFRKGLTGSGSESLLVERADGFAYCMSGRNSYEAFAAFQRSRTRRLEAGDLVLVHCNSYADGFWTDITRTYSMGEPDGRKRAIYEAVFEASRAAIDEIRPGVEARRPDAAARKVLERRGFGEGFRHGLGHAVGFHAIDHNAPPRLHPASRDRLEAGMVFNVEPAVYIEGLGGVRHCDMVAVTASGAEVLTPFQSGIEQMVIA